jgi:hypothetical protein
MRARLFSGLLLTFLTALGLFLAGPAMAQPAREPGVQPLDRILPGIRRDYPGSFYDADGPTPGPDGQEHYHLKWMTPDGRIEWLDTDARTGRVLGAAPGRDTFDGPGGGRLFRPAPSMPTPQGFGERREPPQGFGERREPPQGFGERRDTPPDFGARREFRGEGEFRGGGRGGYGGGQGRRGH